MSWLELIQKALANLGGIAALPKLYLEIGQLRGKPLSHVDQATVRKEIERHSSDSEVWQRQKDLFYSIRGVGRGVWGLRSAAIPNAHRQRLRRKLRPSRWPEKSVSQKDFRVQSNPRYGGNKSAEAIAQTRVPNLRNNTKTLRRIFLLGSSPHSPVR